MKFPPSPTRQPTQPRSLGDAHSRAQASLRLQPQPQQLPTRPGWRPLHHPGACSHLPAPTATQAFQVYSRFWARLCRGDRSRRGFEGETFLCSSLPMEVVPGQLGSWQPGSTIPAPAGHWSGSAVEEQCRAVVRGGRTKEPPEGMVRFPAPYGQETTCLRASVSPRQWPPPMHQEG